MNGDGTQLLCNLLTVGVGFTAALYLWRYIEGRQEVLPPLTQNEPATCCGCMSRNTDIEREYYEQLARSEGLL